MESKRPIPNRTSLLLFLLAHLVLIGCGDADDNQGGTVFTLLSPRHTGIDFTNEVTDSATRNTLRYEYFYNGGGVAIGDIDGDRLPDVFFTSNLGPNRLYLNRGNMTFEDATQRAGLLFERDSTWNTGVTMADINGDGHLDLYLCRSGNVAPPDRANLLFINQGDGTFAERAGAYGLDDTGHSVQAAFFDYDKDGDLDAYVAGHGTGFYGSALAPAQRTPHASTGRLYENRGHTFVNVTSEAGVDDASNSYGLGVATGDLNGDGWDDLYVANDFAAPDYLYINNGDGTFSSAIQQATRHVPYSSMGVDVADYNNDGALDLLVLDMAPDDHVRRMMNHAPVEPRSFYYNVRRGLHHQYAYNTLQLNNGNGTFSDVAWLAGLAATDWSWAPLFADFDNDGRKDVFVSNGIRRDILNRDFRTLVNRQLARGQASRDTPRFADAATVRIIEEDMPSEKINNYVFQNLGGLAFRDRTDAWGLSQPSFSHGAAYGDLDRDGDLDLVVNNLDSPAFVYRNETSQRGSAHYLRVRLHGPPGNREALGAKVRVTHGDTTQLQQKYRTRGYQSSVEGVLHFGLGPTQTVDEVHVTWPNDSTQVLQAVPANRVLDISYDPSADADNEKSAPSPWFRPAHDELNIDYEHQENRFNEFRQQPLIPHKMSQLGPGLAVGDVNGDRLDDIFVGGARGTTGQLFIQERDGRFAPSEASPPWLQDRSSEDMGSLFFDADGDQDQDLYVVSGGSAVSARSPSLQDRLYVNDGTGTFYKSGGRLPTMRSSGSCVKAGDYDNDGDLDLFVGGRGEPQQYPRPSRSYLLENRNGTFKDVTDEQAPALATPGMVTDALWTDVNADGTVELMIAGEWMPIRVFAYRQGRFHDISDQVGLSGSEGWWFSLAEADLDGDGDPDYLVGNNGLNFRYQATPQQPFHLFASDFDGNGSTDPILAYFEDETLYPLALRDVLAQQLPRVRGRFADYASYATASLEEVLGETALETAHTYTVRTFASSVLLNQGGTTLERHPLPREAQFSSVNGFVVDDFNGDGNTDVVLAGNLYEVEPRTPRNDAGNGLVLKGDGKGRFTPLEISQSGLFAPGNVKAVAGAQTPQGSLVLVANNDGRLQAFLALPTQANDGQGSGGEGAGASGG